jgi:hypothetical protein
MKLTLPTIFKLILTAILTLIWFVLIQAEYEIITKPELRDECPVFQGFGAVLFGGFIILVLSVIIILISKNLWK